MDIEFINKIIELRKQKIGYKKIAKIMNISNEKVSKILITNGYTDHVILPPKEDIDKIIKMYCEEKIGSKKIASVMKMSAEKIRNILLINNIELNLASYHSGYKDKICHNYFDIIDTERKAYWLGLLYADGYNNEKFYQIELSLKKEDRYLLEYFKKDLKTVYDIKERNIELNEKIYPQSRIILYSKKISNDLKKIGCIQNKSLILNFPQFDKIPQNLIRHFMRGYFDGDGCISGNKFMINGTKSFVEKYVNILREKTGISKAESWYKDGQAYRWQHASKSDLKKIYDFLYSEASVFLTRKKNKFYC